MFLVCYNANNGKKVQRMGKIQKRRWITYVPNTLSFVRIAMIPLFVWLYFKGHLVETAIVLFLSGVTDLADGIIARKCNAITDMGKILDPIADKLTQGAMLFCLFKRFPLMLLPFVLLLVKELATGITGLIAVKKSGTVKGAVWHGKVNTCLFYAVMLVHILWYHIPSPLSATLIIGNVITMLISFVLYVMGNIKMIINKK